MRAPLPSNEPERLQALHRFNVLDTLPEQAFDDITRLASAICETPVSLVSLVDEDRQWFKSRLGMQAQETHRDLAFCSHAILDSRPLVVEDTLLDSRFSDNDLVTGGPRIRFYAGSQLWTDDGFALGTLCVIDFQPRRLTPQQLDALQALSRQTMAQLKLISTNQRLEMAIHGSTDGLWDWFHLKQQDWWWSHRCYELLGYGPGSLRLSTELVANLVHPEDLPALESQLVGHSSLERQQFDVDARLRTASGDFRWFHVRGIVLRDAQGHITRVAGSLSDIDVSKRAQVQLRLAGEKLQGILRHVADGIILVNERGKIELMNPAAESILGYAPLSMVGRSMAHLTHQSLPDWTGDLPQFLAQFELGPSTDGRLVMGRKADGGEVPLDMAVGVMELAGQNLYIISIRDASNRLANEQALRRSKALAESANSAKSEFLANMSHELRTPLNAIIGFSEVLQDQTFGTLNPKQARYLGNIVGSGRHLLTLVNHILDLFKVESGKLEMEFQEVDFSVVCQEAVTLTSSLALNKSIQVVVEGQDSIWVWADTGRLRQILFNLLSNAIKFTPEGGLIQVGWQGLEESNHLKVWVKDNGVGIKPEDHERVFLEFEQVETGYSRTQQGTGLGLALTRRLLEAHQGQVWLESPGVPGQGTTVFFTLPLLEKGPSLPPPQLAEPEVSPRCQPVSDSAPKILIAEDDSSAAELLDHYLRSAGYRTFHARTGHEALELAQTLRPDVITLDLGLPGLDGQQVLAGLAERAQERNIPVIVISVLGRKESGLNVKAVAHLSKPVHQDELLGIVAQWVNRN